MKKAFATYLGSDSFLPGLIVLNQSLRNYKNNYPLIVIVSELVSKRVIDILKNELFTFRIVPEIRNPWNLKNDIRNFRLTYTKLHIFNLTDFERIVYLDADMLVCDEISILFEKPHMSAVIAGAIIPGNNSWVELNSGLIVIEPNFSTFNKMIKLINILPAADCSDQGFLHSFFNKWKFDLNLHLDHRFNVPYVYLDQYCERSEFDFTYCNGKLSSRNISIIHYWGVPKPWHIEKESMMEIKISKREQSILLWWSYYDEFFNKIDQLNMRKLGF